MGMNLGVFSGDGDPADELEPVYHENNTIRYEVEVYREHPVATDVYYKAKEVELVRPGSTLVNVGAGPVLPTNPYEGQVWILT